MITTIERFIYPKDIAPKRYLKKKKPVQVILRISFHVAPDHRRRREPHRVELGS
jgi:hypothetical protein